MLASAEIVRWAILGVAVALWLTSLLCLRRALGAWPRAHNSVSFILRPGTTMGGNKGH